MRHLRTLVITYACLDVMHTFDERCEVVLTVIEQAFAYDDPMADVAGEAQSGHLPDQVERDPRAIQGSRPMCFETAKLLVLGGELQRTAEEFDLLRERP